MDYTSKSARILQKGMARMRARRQKEGLPPALEFTAWAAEVGMVMDSDRDRADYADRGPLFDDPGSDVHDTQPRP